MAEKGGPRTPKMSGSKRRRPQPTIDLTATELPSEPIAAPASSTSEPAPIEPIASSVDPEPPAAEATVSPASATEAWRTEIEAPPPPQEQPTAGPAMADEPVVPAETVAETGAPASGRAEQVSAGQNTQEVPAGQKADEAIAGQKADEVLAGQEVHVGDKTNKVPAGHKTDEVFAKQKTEEVLAGQKAEEVPSRSAAELPFRVSDERQSDASVAQEDDRVSPSPPSHGIGARIAQASPLTAAAVGAGAAALVAIALIVGLWRTGVTAHDERVPSLTARVGEVEGRLAAQPAPASDERIAAIGQRVLEVVDPRVRSALDAERTRVKEIDERLARVEEAARAQLPAAGPPANTDSAAAVLAQVQELEKRLASTDASLTAVSERVRESGLAGRSAETDGAIKSLADASAALRGRVDEVAALAQAANDAAARSSGEFSARAAEIAGAVQGMSGRMAALEDTLKGLQAAVSRSTAPDVDRAARFAVAALALRGAVERGDPFASELASVKPLVSDPASLAPLEEFAATGVPGAGALARELSSLAAARQKVPEAEPPGSGVIDRLQAAAGKLVRIRPVDAPAAADAGDAIARVEIEAARGDLAGALATLAQLPTPERAAFEPWIKKAQARALAVERVAQVAGAALDALGKTR
jgi:hypothetical protein